MFAVEVLEILAGVIPQSPLKQGIEFAAVGRGRHALEALGAPDLELDLGVGRGGRGDCGMIRGANCLAVNLGLEHRLDAALEVRLNQVGAEFVADPQGATGELETLWVKVGAGQVTLLASFMDDAERDFFVRVMQENGLQALERTFAKVDLITVEVEHEIG